VHKNESVFLRTSSLKLPESKKGRNCGKQEKLNYLSRLHEVIRQRGP
jgi:hypothetical protein